MIIDNFPTRGGAVPPDTTSAPTTAPDYDHIADINWKSPEKATKQKQGPTQPASLPESIKLQHPKSLRWNLQESNQLD